MRNINKQLLISLAAGLLVFLIIFNNLHLPFNVPFTQGARSFLFSKISIFGSFVSELKTIKNLTTENISLKETNNKLLSQIASLSDLQDENKFLRSALDMPVKQNHELIEARVFNIQFTPEGHNMLVDRGLKDGIKPGDIVISSSMILIGRIAEVNDDTSRVELLINQDFKVTVKVSKNDIIGIARGILSDGILLDFISQNDDVNPGDVIVTNGNDLFPPGLIIGKVSRIDSNDGSLFKKVFVMPEFQNSNISRVIILK